MCVCVVKGCLECGVGSKLFCHQSGGVRELKFGLNSICVHLSRRAA